MPQTIDPQDPRLRLHPIVKQLPQWPDDDPRLAALANDVATNGVLESIKITSDHLIVDGRHRWRAARMAGLSEVPYVTVEDGEAATVAISSLIQRRHYSKGALAYVAYPIFQEAFEEAKTRQTRGLKKGRSSPLPIESATGNIGDFANFLGVDRDTLYQAKAVHKLFFSDPEYKAQMEPRIIEDGYGLGAVIAGHAGQQATKGKARNDQPETARFFTTFRSLAIRCSKVPDVAEFGPVVTQVVSAMDDEEELERVETLGRTMAAEAKARRAEIADRLK